MKDTKKDISDTINIKDRFVCSAIIWQDGIIYTWARHCHCIRQMALKWVKQVQHNSQWFLLADWRFIDREDWLKLAKETNQLLTDEPIHWNILYSENLW